jgi:diguanylate cyclase (GGDEF)-like protein
MFQKAQLFHQVELESILEQDSLAKGVVPAYKTKDALLDLVLDFYRYTSHLDSLSLTCSSITSSLSKVVGEEIFMALDIDSLGKNLYSCFPEENPQDVLNKITQLLIGNTPLSMYIVNSGKNKLGLITRKDLADDMAAAQIIYQVKDHMFLAIENARQHKINSQDSLTQLLNHKNMQELSIREVSRLEKSRWFGRRYDLSMMFIDVNNFKQYNDAYGHQEGDKVLRIVAGLFEDAFPYNALISRYGGDEFAIILPNTLNADAMKMAEKCRQMLKDKTTELFQQGFIQSPITISSSIYTAPPNTDLLYNFAISDKTILDNFRSAYSMPPQSSVDDMISHLQDFRVKLLAYAMFYIVGKTVKLSGKDSITLVSEDLKEVKRKA